MIGKRIVFCTCGSLGDIHPFLALARELQHRGHSPVIATSPAYRKLIEAQDVEFHPVRPDIDISDPNILRRVMDKRTGGRYIICDLLSPALGDAYDDTSSVCADADLIVTHPFALAAFLFARKSGTPWASVALAPVSLYSIYDPSVLCGLPFAEKLASFGPSFQRRLMKAVAFLQEPLWKQFRQFEKRLGLPASPNPLFWGHSPELALGLFSAALAAPQRDWPANAHTTGFPFFSHDDGNSAELQRFLELGDAPIVFMLGSAAVGVAGHFYEESAEIARRLGQRALLLVGRDGRNQPKRPLPPGVMAVSYAPANVVFPRASVIVHQGGIGTTAEAMRAGRPMLVVPYCHDQLDHAARLTRLGIARSISREKYNSETATPEIQVLLENAEYSSRAAAIASRVRKESGSITACDLIERLLQTSVEHHVPDELLGQHSQICSGAAQ